MYVCMGVTIVAGTHAQFFFILEKEDDPRPLHLGDAYGYVCMGVTIVAGTHAQWVEVYLIVIIRKDTRLASESSEAQSGVLFVSRHIAIPL